MNTYLCLFVLLTSLWSTLCVADDPDGSCWSDPQVTLDVQMTGTFSGSTKGSTAKYSWKVPGPGYYTVTCAPNPNMDKKKNAGMTKGDFGVISNDGTTGHLTDSIDITAIANYPNQFIPYYNFYSGVNYVVPVAGGPTGANWNAFETGNGTLTLTKDAIGGAIEIPPGIIFARLFEGTYADQYSNKWMARLRTTRQILPVLQICSINNNQTINVTFPNIELTQLTTDGRSATVKFDQPLNYACTTALTQDIGITFAGGASLFSSDALATSNNNIGVELLYNNEIVPPDGHFNTKLTNGTGSDTITFVPVKSPTATDAQLEGNFTASATLIMTSA